MSEQVTEPAPSAAAGEPTTPPEGFVSRADLDAVEMKRRDAQSKLDKAIEENKKLQASLSPATPAAPATSQELGASEERIARLEAALASLNPETIADQFTARFNQQQMLAAARTKAKEDFPHARPEVFEGEFDGPEALVAAVQASHESEKAAREAIAREERERIAAELEKEHGIRLASAPQTTSTAPPENTTGLPQNRADMARMPMADFLKLTPEQYEAANKE